MDSQDREGLFLRGGGGGRGRAGKYLEALLRDAHDAEDVAQDFLLRGILKGFLATTELRGRFRDYLKAAVRNAALMHLRRRRLAPGPDPAHLAAADPPPQADQEWVADWRRCVLDRAWQALDRHQARTPGNLAYTVLRLATDHAEEDSTTLAARASARAGRPLRADAFRKQLSRARRHFAELVVAEVAQTLERPTAERVEEELAELGLLADLRDFLPPDWRSRIPPESPE